MQASYSLQYADLWRSHWWWQARQRIVLRTVQGALKQTARPEQPRQILDIGCGGGVALEDWSRFGDVWGIEPDPHLLRNSPLHWRTRIEHASFDGNYTPSRRYDLVLMLDVLEHLADDTAAAERLWDLLRPGGQLVITVPALPSLWSVHDQVNGHYRRYTKQRLANVLRAAGFQVRTIRYCFLWPLGLMYFRKLLPGRGRYRVQIPPRPMNAAFRTACRWEEWLFRCLPIAPPLGGSLLAVACRPAKNE